MAETREEQIARWEREGHAFEGPPPGIDRLPVDANRCWRKDCGRTRAEHARPSSMSVVDEDRLTRRNPDHLDDWRFR